MTKAPRALLVVIAAGCGGRGEQTSDAASAPSGVSATSPEVVTQEIFAVLGRIDLAIRKQDPGLLSPAFTDRYVLVACGTARVIADPTAAATARMRRGGERGWHVTLANDGQMAWAIGEGDGSIVNLEVLERRGGAWKLVAGSASTGNPVPDGICEPGPAGVTDTGGSPPPAALTWIAADATLLRCARWPGMAQNKREWSRDETETVAALDTNGNGVVDFIETTATAVHLSAGGHMAWFASAGAGGGFSTLTIAEQRVGGWFVAASVWSPDAALAREHCVGERGRVVVTDTSIEILDQITFERDNSEVPVKAYPILDAVAATLVGNPSIRVMAVVARAEAGERDPWLLSERRGLAVRDYLRGKGIAVERLEVHYFGDGAPLPKPQLDRGIQFEIQRRDSD